MTRSLCFTLHTSESILLQHVAREALAAERARRVDATVVADAVLIYLALIHVLNGSLGSILTILLFTDGEGLFTIWAIWY